MRILIFLLTFYSFALQAQTRVYDVVLWGNKIGTSTIERMDNGNGEVRYKLNSHSEVDNFFVTRKSLMQFDVVYRNGRLFSAYVKDVKNDKTEITTIQWDGVKYLVKKGDQIVQITQSIDFSAVQLYFFEPAGRPQIFSERLGAYCNFTKEGEGEYLCEVDGVDNTYRYRNGVLYELEMSKGASVYLRLVQ